MDKVYYARYFIIEAFLQFSLLGGVLALWGMFRSYRNNWRFGLYCELVAMLSSSLLLIGLLGFDYEYIQIAVFRPYPLVAYCILALWFGYGINELMQVANKWRKLSPKIIISSFSLVILTLGIYNGRTNYRANDRFAEQYAQSLFDVIEQNAVLVTHGDAYGMTTAYYHLVEGKRLDVRLLESSGHGQNDRVVNPLWSKKQKSVTWKKFVRKTNRPFYHQSLASVLSSQNGHASAVFAFKIDNSLQPKEIRIETNDSAKMFFKKNVSPTSNLRPMDYSFP